MRWVIVILAGVVVAGCEKESARAERQAEIVERTGDKQAVCQAKRKVAEAYLKEGNEGAYRRAKLSADVGCLTADLDTQGRMLEADNMADAPN